MKILSTVLKIKSHFLITMFCFAVVSTACAGPLPFAKPEDVGFSSTRLNRIDTILKADTSSGKLVGAVVMIARKGKIAYFKSFGMRDKAVSAPLKTDAIFRIYSMTKPFVSVATMILHEEGKLFLSDPISKYLPEYSEMKVGVVEVDKSTDNEILKTVVAYEPITIQDLLRHTSGMTYGVFGWSLIKTEYLKAGINSPDQTLEEMSKKLAKIPLVNEPGTLWEYSRSTDILGRLVEVASGMTLDKYLEKKIFKPLGMRDSGFYVKKRNLNRIAEQSAKNPTLLNITKPPKMLSGGGGGVSTASDYVRFCQMLLNGGQLEATRILSPKTVEYMTSDHLGPLANRTDRWFLPGDGYGFGLGFAVRTKTGESTWPGTIGDYWWGGWAGTYFWIDPKEELIVVYMMQDPSSRMYYRRLIRNLVYQAVIE